MAEPGLLARLLGRRPARRRILLAPDSYGGFLSAPEAAERMAARLRGRGLACVMHPMSDGGEGLLEALRAHRPLRVAEVDTTDAWGRPLRAELGFLQDQAVVETARIIGRGRGGEARPMEASSAGLAAVLRALPLSGPAPWLGLGGSATVEGGLGLLLSLGLRAEDAAGQRLEGPPAQLLARLDALRGELAPLPALLLADVRCPLSQAVLRFGGQKGLGPEALGPHQARLDRFGEALATWSASQGRRIEPELAGGGAAGGLGLCLLALGASMAEGAEHLARWTGLDAAVQGVDAVVIGEGRFDRGSLEGKVASAVMRRARAAGRPVFALVGRAEAELRGEVDGLVETGAPGDAAFLDGIDRLGALIRGA